MGRKHRGTGSKDHRGPLKRREAAKRSWSEYCPTSGSAFPAFSQILTTERRYTCTALLALKIYGASTAGVVNGSMGFNEATFEPNYHLQFGLPGKSAGLEIATRLGMPEDIMRRARHSMSDRERDVTRFLSELHNRIEQTQVLERDLRAQIEQLAKREKELAQEWEKRETAKLKELERRTDVALARFEEQAQETIAACGETGIGST